MSRITGGGHPRPHDGQHREEPTQGPSGGGHCWANPLLIGCSCRHCRKGRMCRDQADRFRSYVRQRETRLLKGAPEWLLRSCTSCGFCWPEACADGHVSSMFGEAP